MKLSNPFRDLTKFELLLWLTSVGVITVSFLLLKDGSILTLLASLIGVTALIFVAKGYVIGQVLTVVFAVFYGIISFSQHYYGEMITYLGMSAPMAALAVAEWVRHPYKGTKEVAVSRLSRRRTVFMWCGALISTVAFYFILNAMGNSALIVSTVSVTTSFLASYLTFCRSPYYALAYAANDIVLIVLWIMAALGDASCFPMIFCFVMFFANDMYGFVNWRRMQSSQT